MHSPEFGSTRYLSMQHILSQRDELHAAHALREAEVEAKQATGPAPAVAPTVKPVGPQPLTTGDIAFCFDGLGWDEKGWKKSLGDLRKWLKPCLVIPGTRGGHARRWNPVLIGAALYRKKGVPLNRVRARFQSKPALKPWLEEWRTYEADNFDAE